MTTYALMARNNAWANDRLLTACLELSEQEWTAKRPNPYPSIKATLDHLHLMDLFYLDALTNGGQGQAILDHPEPAQDVAEFMTTQWDTDARLIRFCEDLQHDGERVAVERRHGLSLERTDILLMQLFQHQIHHRGQVHGMLSSTSVKPPKMDGFYLLCDRNPSNPIWRAAG